MAYSYKPETFVPSTMTREESVSSLLQTLERLAAALCRDISFEEERSGIKDPKDSAYSTLARNLRERERNIRSTITSLQTTSAAP